MKLTKLSQVDSFLAAVNSCEGGVYLTSPAGDRYNLKSALSQFVAVGELLGQKGDELELWCDKKEDEAKLLKFFYENPDVV